MIHFKRKLRNIYHSIRILGLRKGLKVSWRILFPPKISKELLEFSRSFSVKDVEDAVKRGNDHYPI